MLLEKLNRTVDIAQEFVQRATDVLEETRKSTHPHFIQAGKTTGAVTRASMELTRALADLRNNR